MAFRVKPRQKDGGGNAKIVKTRWHTFNLIPTVESHGHAKGQEAYHKMICYLVADGVPSEVTRLYQDVPLSQVWEFYGLKKAASW